MNSSNHIAVPVAGVAPDLRSTPVRWLEVLRGRWLALVGRIAADPARLAFGALLLLALVFIVYRPILPGSFLIDDRRLIKDENPLVNGALGPLSIWFRSDFTLSSFVLWLQWLVWADQPGGYHAVNMALHALSAFLLWRLLARLKIPGAGLAAAIFAVHPVCVNSVARISEIKNTLSLPFFILSFWAYLRYEKVSAKAAMLEPGDDYGHTNRAALWYGFSLVVFVLALLSKPSTVMLPVILLGAALWQRGRIARRDWLHTAPFFVLSLAFGLMSIWFQKHQALAGSGQVLQPENFGMRLAIAGRVVWHYLGKALLPVNLQLVYPRWNMDAAAWTAYVPMVLLVVVSGVCWKFRRGWGRYVLFGLGCFIINLFPVLGLFDSQFLATWQVSDHLQYLPLIAPIVLVAAGITVLLNSKTGWGVAIALIVVLSVLTFQRAQVFATEEGLFRDALVKNPTVADVHNDLGVILAQRGNYPEASIHFRAAVQADPVKVDALVNLGEALDLSGDSAEAQACYLTALRLEPENPEAHKWFAKSLAQQGKFPEAVMHLKVALCLKPDDQSRLYLARLLYKTGDFGQAGVQFRRVLSANPDMPEALNNLAWLLSTCSDDTVRNGPEAVVHAEHACRQTAYKQSAMLSTLAAAYAEAGRFEEAIKTAEKAMDMQIASGENRLAVANEQLLSLYHAGKPYHERTR